MNRVVIIGASRGLGAELCAIASRQAEVLGVSRSQGHAARWFKQDLSKDISPLLETLKEFKPNQIFYVAGGGPFGDFASKDFKDHQWCFRTTFESAARVVHEFLGKSDQIVLCGSAVAEANADPKAASYAAAKHALKGLYASIIAEKPSTDLRLFSPGYLDTELLPKNASVRYKGVWDPKVVAMDLWQWSENKQGRFGHKIYTNHPE